MTNLQLKDLIENEIYTTVYGGYTFRKLDDLEGNSLRYMCNGSYHHNTSGSLNSERNSSFKTGYRLPTQEEKDHFLQCEFTGKYVPYTIPYKDNYLILN